MIKKEEEYSINDTNISEKDVVPNMPLRHTESLSTGSDLVDTIGVPAMLEQTAEEAVELAKACLKLARYYRGENKVYGKTEEELKDNLCEELADIWLCRMELIESETALPEDVDKWQTFKERLKEGKDIPMPKVAKYCDNDVLATEAAWNARKAEFDEV